MASSTGAPSTRRGRGPGGRPPHLWFGAGVAPAGRIVPMSFGRASRPERGGGHGWGAPAEARVPGLTTRESVHRLQVPGHLPRMLVPGAAVRIRLFRAPAREASTPA